ncbi:MAG TPA: flagellar biosynthetic protein FliQ [Calidithermus sp.]|nr:flagellar biosynthetic protein FliQ [Calidithermus sp.]
MTADAAVEIGRQALWTALVLMLPVLVVSAVVGLVVALAQAVTQLQEPTLAFLPKALALAATLLVLGPWMLRVGVGYLAATLAGLAGVAGP